MLTVPVPGLAPGECGSTPPPVPSAVGSGFCRHPPRPTTAPEAAPAIIRRREMRGSTAAPFVIESVSEWLECKTMGAMCWPVTIIPPRPMPFCDLRNTKCMALSRRRVHLTPRRRFSALAFLEERTAHRNVPSLARRPRWRSRQRGRRARRTLPDGLAGVSPWYRGSQRRVRWSSLGSGAGRRHFLPVVLARLAGAFLAGAFLAGAFLAGALRAGFLAGPLARFSASFSIATGSVISSTVSVARSETLVVPSVMYGPKRPSLITIGFSLVGSVPSSFSGGLAAARPRVLGWA